MHIRPAVAFACVIFALAACSPGTADAGFPDGTGVHTIIVGGRERSYRVYKPAGLTAQAPLVVMMHGGFGTGEQAEKSYGWDQLADSAKFVVAYPDGIGKAWNVHGCCGRPARDNIDDVGFITAMIARISHALSVDQARVYATGISNGGMMAYTLACNSAMFAAIGPDSATQLDACASPHPTSVMHIHGTADRLIRYDGSPGAGVATPNGGPSMPDLNAFWRNVDQCAAPTVTTDGPLTTSTATCPDNRGVVLITIDGGGHQWPGGTTFLERQDPTSRALNTTSTVWQFFAAHPA
jgi:polyhydroxybutyrate depolymerase